VKILVTGGAGFIGHHLVRQLHRATHDVVVLDNLHRPAIRPEDLVCREFIEGDIRKRDDVLRALDGCQAVIHLAAQSNVVGSDNDPSYTFSTNVVGTWTVGQAARNAGVDHFIFASSREVYGEVERLPVSESTHIAPKNLYGATKASGELLLRAIDSTAMNVSILRLANVIGPGDSERVLPNWLSAARQGKVLALFGGQQVLDFVPIETVVAAVFRLLERGAIEGPVNIGSGKPTALRDLASQVTERIGSLSSVKLLPARTMEVTRFVADVTRMRDVLGVMPPEDPLQGIEEY
jgi:nucleoside-diphosphate-sugar epimerase